MAKIKYSALVSDMRNKLNGSVLSKNRYGSYIRNKVTPVNPQTSYQQNARQQLGVLSSQWNGLTDAQRSGWRALASQIPSTDIFGDQKFLSGQVLYVKLNANLDKIGETTVSPAPAPVSIPAGALSSLVAEETAGAMVSLDLTFNITSMPAGFKMAIYATPGVRPGRSFVKNQFRYIGSADTITASEFDALALWNARFGTVNPGDRIFVRTALVSTGSGQQGTPSEAVGTIATV